LNLPNYHSHKRSCSSTKKCGNSSANLKMANWSSKYTQSIIVDIGTRILCSQKKHLKFVAGHRPDGNEQWKLEQNRLQFLER